MYCDRDLRKIRTVRSQSSALGSLSEVAFGQTLRVAFRLPLTPESGDRRVIRPRAMRSRSKRVRRLTGVPQMPNKMLIRCHPTEEDPGVVVRGNRVEELIRNGPSASNCAQIYLAQSPR